MSDYGFISDPDLGEDHKGFIIAEEYALKAYLSGIEVPFKGTPKLVPVYFRWPSAERQMQYPFITIDLLSVTAAYERWHSYFPEFSSPAYYENVETGEVTEKHYWPGYSGDLQPEDPDNDLWASNFLPYNLMFQISTFARTATDDRYLMSRFFTDIVGPRSFFIPTYADGVYHRCELLEFISADTLETIEATKRQFRKIYTVLMETELPTSKVLELQKVRTLHIDIYDKTSDTRLAPEHPVDSPAHDGIAEHITNVATP